MGAAGRFESVGGLLPAVLDVPEAAHLLGVGRTLAYQLVRAGLWPTPVIRVGRLIKVPTQPLLHYLATGESGTG
jgi:excisionase family DNA binding protein